MLNLVFVRHVPCPVIASGAMRHADESEVSVFLSKFCLAEKNFKVSIGCRQQDDIGIA